MSFASVQSDSASWLGLPKQPRAWMQAHLRRSDDLRHNRGPGEERHDDERYRHQAGHIDDAGPLQMRLLRAPQLPCEPVVSAGLQIGLLLPGRSHSVHPDRSQEVPAGPLLRAEDMHPDRVQLRVQVPGGLVCAHRQRAPVLHPGEGRCQPNGVPDRLQVRPAGHVQRHQVSQRDLRVLRGEEVVRPVPRRAVLPGCDQVGALPGGVLLRARLVVSDAVPVQLLLPAGVVQGRRLPGPKEVGPGGEVERVVHVIPRAPGGSCAGEVWRKN